MSDYLLEVGVEELPAGFVPEALDRLCQLLKAELEANSIEFSEIASYATPRRLAALVKNISKMQKTTEKTVKGPPVKSSFDEKGKPLGAALGFAQKNGLTVEELTREEVAGVTYLFARVVTPGKPTKDVLPALIEKVIPQISGERLMRWGSCSVKFSRPLRWFVSLLDKEVVPFSLAGIESGRHSRGHRILHGGQVEISEAISYEGDLEKAFVMVDAGRRQAKIEKEVKDLAGSLKGHAMRLDKNSSLVEEVVYLTEWPVAVMGDLEPEYLALPSMLIETIMVHHQRYFPLSKDEKVDEEAVDHKLLPHFITISNNDSAGALSKIKQGNERVLRARLADGKFFYFDDGKQKLQDRSEALGKLTYQEGLGSYKDKTERMVELAGLLAEQSGTDGGDRKALLRTCALMKLDLVTGLVRELPELQGFVGSWYAGKDGEDKSVVRAIASHYAPRFSQDAIPQDRVGQLAAVVDKLDHVTGLFALGKKPSGSSDPYALRRNAQGLIDILVDGMPAVPVNLVELIDKLMTRFEPLVNGNGKFNRQEKSLEVQDFLLQRLKGKLLDLSYSREIVECAMATGSLENIADLLVRLTVLKELAEDAGKQGLLRVGVRIGNILKADSKAEVDAQTLTEPEEKALWQAFQVRSEQLKVPDLPTANQYKQLCSHLSELVEPVDAFFDKILVNDEDRQKRQNRHGILKHIDNSLKRLGDFTRLQALIN